MKYYVLFGLLMLCVVCVGADGEGEAGKTVLWLWQNLFKFLGAIVVPWVIGILKAKAKVYNVEVSEKTEESLVKYADKALSYSEEHARKALKLAGIQESADEKFNRAVKKMGEWIPYLEEQEIKDYLVSALPAWRDWASDYIGSKVDPVDDTPTPVPA